MVGVVVLGNALHRACGFLLVGLGSDLVNDIVG